MYLQLPAGVIVTSLFVYGGLVLYAKYPVDPVSDCTITLPDQVNPQFIYVHNLQTQSSMPKHTLHNVSRCVVHVQLYCIAF